MGQTRTERKRAEKAANREAKANKKQVAVVEEKKKRMGNGLLALMIFGVVAAMFVIAWGYNYAQKEASIEAYITNHGGEDTYSNMVLSDEQTMSVTAEGNDMTIALDVDCPGGGDEDVEYYKGDEGQKYLKYINAYYLGSMKPSCRGASASAKLVVKVNGEKATTVETSWSEVEDILEENGIQLEDIAEHDHDHEDEAETEAEE